MHRAKVHIEYDIVGRSAVVKDTKIIDNSASDTDLVFPAPYYDRVRPEAKDLEARDENDRSMNVATEERDGITYLVLSPDDGINQFRVPARSTKSYTVKYRIPNYLTKKGCVWYFSNHYGYSTRYEAHDQFGRVEKTAIYRIALGPMHWAYSFAFLGSPDKFDVTRSGKTLTLTYEFNITPRESEYNIGLIQVSKARWLAAAQALGLIAIGVIADRAVPPIIKWLAAQM